MNHAIFSLIFIFLVIKGLDIFTKKYNQYMAALFVNIVISLVIAMLAICGFLFIEPLFGAATIQMLDVERQMLDLLLGCILTLTITAILYNTIHLVIGMRQNK